MPFKWAAGTLPGSLAYCNPGGLTRQLHDTISHAKTITVTRPQSYCQQQVSSLLQVLRVVRADEKHPASTFTTILLTAIEIYISCSGGNHIETNMSISTSMFMQTYLHMNPQHYCTAA